MLREGHWHFRSASDPRWNCRGRGVVGMFCDFESVPSAKKAFDKKYKKLGRPPDDLTWSYLKD